MAGERIFKRRLAEDESFAAVGERDERAALIEELAAMSPAEKAALPPDLKKALRNEVLLADVTASIPTAEEGFAARALREMRSRRS